MWDLIRDFFVQLIFGGVDSGGDFYEYTLGTLRIGGEDTQLYTDTPLWSIGSLGGSSVNISLGDWLSTTATAISITIIVVLCCLFVYKIIRLIGGLIR